MNPDLYLRVRELEGRIYSDDIVRNLPSIPAGHPLGDEWRARSASASRLSRYLERFSNRLTILDLGCGNGWLSNLLAKSGHDVVGMDQNLYELKQATRVFSSNPNLLFIETDIFQAPFENENFDIVLLASSIQYFNNIPGLLAMLRHYLKPSGEVHMIDSPLYRDEELGAAAQRSREYYSQLGYPEMADMYFHHPLSALTAFKPKVLYQPHPRLIRVKRWLKRIDSPFPWISFQKQSIQ